MTSEQQNFRWKELFGTIIRSNGNKLDFLLLDGEMTHTYTAWKSNNELHGRRYGEEIGRFAWEGIISDSAQGEPQGEVACSFAWGALDCTIRIFLDEVDSQFQVVIQEATTFIIRTLKTDLEESEPELDERASESEFAPPSILDPYEVAPPMGIGEIGDPDGVTVIHEIDDLHGTFPEIGDPDIDAINGTYSYPNGNRRLLQMTRATDVIVFYTSAAAWKKGSSSALEDDIADRIDQFNAALDAAGISGNHKRLNLAATWELYNSNSSNKTSWIGSFISATV